MVSSPHCLSKGVLSAYIMRLSSTPPIPIPFRVNSEIRQHMYWKDMVTEHILNVYRGEFELFSFLDLHSLNFIQNKKFVHPFGCLREMQNRII